MPVTAKLTQLDHGVVMAQPSDRIRLIYDNTHGDQKTIAYIGFVDQGTANACFGYLLDQGCTKYNRTADAGLNKVRKAKRVDGCAFEIKWHRPDAEVLHCFIQKDLARTAVAA